MCYSVFKKIKKHIERKALMAQNTQHLKAVFSDIDGTLLNSEHVVTKDTREAIHKITEKGLLFTLSSARGPSGIEPIVQKNGFHCCIIAYSGALILDEDRHVLYENGMTVSDARKIIEFIEMRHLKLTWNIYTSNDWIVKDRTDPRVTREENIVETSSREGDIDALPPDTIIDKILCMCAPGTIQQTESEIKQAFPKFSIVKSSDILIEIMQNGINKAQAVKHLCDIKNISIENTIAFGDNYNDLEMLETVSCGIVMGNAPLDIQNRFQMITADNNHDGIAKALKKLGLVD